MKRPHAQAGMTLVEVTVAIFVLGILSVALSPILNSYVVSLRASYVNKQALNNQLIGAALLEYAGQNGAGATVPGMLPAPYTGGQYHSSVFDPADASPAGQALTATLRQSGLNLAEVNDDNYDAHRVRVYQRIDDPTLELRLPLYFRSGPEVTLRYQFAALYMTTCARADSQCNPTPATSLPGASVRLKASDVQNGVQWHSSAPDGAAFFLSTLPLQKQLLASTAQRLDRMRDAMMSYYRAQQNTAPGNDTSNWWQLNPAAAGATSQVDDCWGGWYALDAPANAVLLSRVGLAPDEYATTAWGGTIEYCPDYDQGGQKGQGNTRPYFAALRFNKRYPSLGLAPDPAVKNNNAILTF